jgi:DNA invertase Pin-like site-specific DNA recombinase
MKTAAIYHFASNSEIRQVIHTGQLRKLEDYAAALGFDRTEVFLDLLDKRLLRRDRSEFDRFLSCAGKYDALFTKDFYHISKTTRECFHTLLDFQDRGIHTYTLENGAFCTSDPPLEKPLRVTAYTCYLGPHKETRQVLQVKNNILPLFVAKKTRWTLVDQYFDESQYQKDEEQIQLRKLISNREKYDLLLVHSFGDIHRRTAKFCKIRDQLRMDIYALQDGLWKYSEGAQK